MTLNEMQIAQPDISRVADEMDLLDELLTLPGASVLELGCGKADKTRQVAQKAASVLALEVDTLQLARNQAADVPANVHFAFGAAEAIPAADASFDIVMMFKSLHHVPTGMMDDALAEIWRVLKTNGVAYLSEPVYAGDFNDILRLFHDEKAVRDAAFTAEKKAVSSGKLSLLKQTFFLQPMHFADFSQYQDRVLNVTHTDHQLTPALIEAIRSAFNRHMTPDGAMFHMPIRVDLLAKNQG